MKLRKYVFCSVAALLFAACGRQHAAESLVKDFMNENLQDVSFSDMDFGKIDSTKRINDSIISKMRSAASQSGRYKRDIAYPAVSVGNGNTLIMLRVVYKLDNDTCSDTYYLDKELTRVIAFKTN